MNALKSLHWRRARGAAGASAGGTVVVSLESERIRQALEERTRYKYVQPRVVREGLGWKVVSPNCSRNVDPQGGEVDIAWLVPSNGGEWLLFSRDHAQDCWQLRHHERSLSAVLAHLCADHEREFWQ